MRTGRPPPPPRGPGRGGLAVGIRSAQPRDMLPAGQEIIPQGEGLRERPANPALGVEGIEEHARQIVQERFELPHVIPQLDPRMKSQTSPPAYPLPCQPPPPRSPSPMTGAARSYG